MATVIEQPGNRTLYSPPPGNDVEALPLLVGRSLQVDLVRVLQAAHPLFQPLGWLGPIHPDVAQPLDPIGKVLAQQLDQP